jgi:glycerol transport system ATP-binding protein
LLNIISGLITPSIGRVFYDGEDVTELPPEKRNIAQVFQFPVLYDTMTVFDNLAFPLRNRGVAGREVGHRVHEIAEILDLKSFLNKKAAGLSADAKQKVSLGRGLVRNDVAAILFDEPLTVIDPQLKWHLRHKIKMIHEELKLTLIYVTHDQVEALTFAEKVAVMHEGTIVQTGTPKDLFENPEHRFVGYFIGSPGMNFLPCTLDGSVAHVNGAEIPLDKEMATLGRKTRGKLELGIRPMYLQLNSKPTKGGVPVQIQTIEDFGSYKLVTVMLADKPLRIRLQEDMPVPSTKTSLVFPTQWIRLYADGKLVRKKD